MKVATLHHDSPRGCWTYSEWRPRHLAGLVEVIWYSEGTANERRDRHFPNGTIELLVNLGDRFRLLEPTGTEVFASTWLAGVQSGPVVTEQPVRHRVLSVRLTPAGAYALLATPMGALSNLVLDLHDVIGRAARELVERCRDATTVEERFQIVAAWVAARVAGARGLDPPVAWAAGRIAESGGAVSVAELRAQTGWSKARLAGRFREQIGVTPKLYARIIRLGRVLDLLHRGAQPLADVALEVGYYDQPHMNLEFRALTGLTPRQYLAGHYPAVR